MPCHLYGALATENFSKQVCVADDRPLGDSAAITSITNQKHGPALLIAIPYSNKPKKPGP